MDPVIRKIHTGRIANANGAADELSRIAKACGGHLKPEDVVRNAKQKSSPLHKYFTWDDTEAAAKYRIIQAAQLIRTIKVTVETHPQDKPITVRAFINVAMESEDDADETESVYVPLATALKVDDYRTQMLENAAKELGVFRKKYALLNELSGLFAEIDKLQMKFQIA